MRAIRRSSDSLAVWSSSIPSSASSLDDLLALLGPLDDELLPFLMPEPRSGREGIRTLPKRVLFSPPLLPLPVEFDAGGDGNPEDEWGLLGGSGSSGSFVSNELAEPMYIADDGRFLVARAGRDVIGTDGAASRQT